MAKVASQLAAFSNGQGTNQLGGVQNIYEIILKLHDARVTITDSLNFSGAAASSEWTVSTVEDAQKLINGGGKVFNSSSEYLPC